MCIIVILIPFLYFTVPMPKQLEVSLIDVCYASKKKKDLPHKHGDLKATDVHNMNLHFPRFGYVCAL